MSGIEDPIVRARTLVRRGDFINAATDHRMMAALKAVSSGHKPAFSEQWLVSRALLAEINDQTGAYEKVSEVFIDGSILIAVRNCLLRSNHNEAPLSDSDRRLFRAQVFFILQAAIHKLRRFELDAAEQLMSLCATSIKANSSDQSQFYGPSSLLNYWQGRMEMARNRMDEARTHFNDSMRQTECNLIFHSDKSSGLADDERIAYAIYSLASCMAFGIAHINHCAGHLLQALDLLHPASAILMRTGDNYRRGYVQMLIGAAERGLAGRDTKQLAGAIKTLETSHALFSGNASYQLQHRLHQARVDYQLALAYIYLAQAQPSHSDHFTKASMHHTRSSSILSEFESVGLGDPELRYDLWISKSRLCRERAEFEDASIAANHALEIARNYHYAPSSSQAKALVSKAEVILARMQHSHRSKAAEVELLAEADAQFTSALGVSGSNWGLITTIQLYQALVLVKRGSIQRARQKYHEAWDKRAKQIQNGWTKQLAEEVQMAVQEPTAEIVLNLDQIKKELASDHSGNGLPLWYEAIERLKKRMVEWAENRNSHEPWRELDVGRSTAYKHKPERDRKQ